MKYVVQVIAVISFCAVSGLAFADASNKVKYKSKVNLKVGQATIVHGLRGECGKLPTKAERSKSKSNLDAKLTTGHIVFGKAGVRGSGSCGGDTPVYETIFVADRPGRETVKIHGDTVRIVVK